MSALVASPCAGLVTPLGGPGATISVLGLAAPGALRPPADLLGLCAAVDERGAALLQARDPALLSATAVLQVRLHARCSVPCQVQAVQRSLTFATLRSA